MAAAFTKTHERDLGGGLKLVRGTIAFDNSYPTAGEAVDMSGHFPGGVILHCWSDIKTCGGYVICHDGGTAAAGKFMAYFGDYDPAAAGPLVEAANATDLSGITAGVLTMIGH